MNLENFQKMFQNAWLAIDIKKAFIVFLSLCVCGIFVVFSRVVAMNTHSWAALSLAFAPIFIVGGLLFAIGAFLIQTYRHQNKSYEQIVIESWRMFVSVCYITLPLLLLSLLCWLVLGVFYLLKAIPVVGEFIGVLLSFAPFVLILASITLVFINLILLFFMTPSLSQHQTLSYPHLKKIVQKVLYKPLMSMLSFVIATLPLMFLLILLIAAAFLTQQSYLTSLNPVLIGLKWFFLMLPFNALLTPAIIFFFNFAAEVEPLLEFKTDDLA